MTAETLKKQAIDTDEILRANVGSYLHGTAIDGISDRDVLGICIEPPEYIIGLQKFEQYRNKPNHVRSGPGDIDYTCMSLREFVRQAAAGDPTAVTNLFIPIEQIIHITWPGELLFAYRDVFLGRHIAPRFIGYIESHHKRTKGRYDPEAAGHAIRIGIHGVELLTTGHITLPVPEPDRTYLINVRKGEIDPNNALNRIEKLPHQLAAAALNSPLPEDADQRTVNQFLHTTYRDWWKAQKI